MQRKGWFAEHKDESFLKLTSKTKDRTVEGEIGYKRNYQPLSLYNNIRTENLKGLLEGKNCVKYQASQGTLVVKNSCLPMQET